MPEEVRAANDIGQQYQGPVVLITDALCYSTTDISRPGSRPGKASLRLAVRRVTRVGKASGLPLEDLGVVPDHIHEFTRADVLHRNVDLINHAAQLLCGLPKQRLVAMRDGPAAVRIESSNIDCVDVFLQDRPFSSRRIAKAARPASSFTLAIPSSRRQRRLRLEGFHNSRLVAVARLPLP